MPRCSMAGGRPARQRRVHRLPAARGGRKATRHRARPCQYLRIRRNAEYLPAGLGARRADARHRGRGHAGAPAVSRPRGRCARNRGAVSRPGPVAARLRGLPQALRAQPLGRRDARALRPAVRRASRMSSASGTVSLSRLKRRALSIGAVKAFDHAMQFLLPLVLVRCLDTATFGEYRLLWLAVGTIMSFATLNMCGTLYYFVPRSDAPR